MCAAPAPEKKFSRINGTGEAGAHSPLCGQEAGTQDLAGLVTVLGGCHGEGLRLALKELRKGSSQELLILKKNLVEIRLEK